MMKNNDIIMNQNELVQFLKKPSRDFTREDIIKFIEAKGIAMLNFRYVADDGKLIHGLQKKPAIHSRLSGNWNIISIHFTMNITRLLIRKVTISQSHLPSLRISALKPSSYAPKQVAESNTDILKLAAFQRMVKILNSTKLISCQ